MELGPSETEIFSALRLRGTNLYVCVEPFVPQLTKQAIQLFLRENPGFQGSLTTVKDDGLTYLCSQPKGSATVVSSMVLCDEVIGANLSKDPSSRDHQLRKQYQKKLCAEIYRVTPVNGVSIHLGLTENYGHSLQDVGFERDPNEPSLFFKRN